MAATVARAVRTVTNPENVGLTHVCFPSPTSSFSLSLVSYSMLFLLLQDPTTRRKKESRLTSG